MDKPWEDYAEKNQPFAERPVLHGSSYMEHLK